MYYKHIIAEKCYFIAQINIIGLIYTRNREFEFHFSDESSLALYDRLDEI